MCTLGTSLSQLTEVHDTMKYEIPGKKGDLLRSNGEVRYKVYTHTKYQIPLHVSTRHQRRMEYKEVRDTKKYEIPGRTIDSRMDDIARSRMRD